VSVEYTEKAKVCQGNLHRRFAQKILFLFGGLFSEDLILLADQNLRRLLSLSKKFKWPAPIIFEPLKINNLQATENCKMARIKVFRQARFFL
jgi:hypothetical protein